MTLKSVTVAKTRKLPTWYTPVTKELLREITQRIVDEFQPERIILFGSYANGNPTIHSDIDLLVVTKKMARESVFVRSRQVSNLFPQRNFGVDILVRTPHEVNTRLEMGDNFMRDIIERGSILYARKRRRRIDSRSRKRLQKRARSHTPT